MKSQRAQLWFSAALVAALAMLCGCQLLLDVDQCETHDDCAEFGEQWQCSVRGLCVDPHSFEINAQAGPGDCDIDAAPFGGGDGSVDAPYLICSPQHLINWSEDPYAFRTHSLALVADIDMAGSHFETIEVFQGNLRGNQHRIENLVIRPCWGINCDVVAFIGYASGASIVDVNLSQISVQEGERAGGLVGELTGGLIENCTVSGDLSTSGEILGGVVGETKAGRVVNSHFNGSLSSTGGFTQIGGLVGYHSSNARIENSSAAGLITDGDYRIGGLVGQNNGVIQDSYSTVNIAVSFPDVSAGGLVGGHNSAQGARITRSWAGGNVDTPGAFDAGGLVGFQTGAENGECGIVESFATGEVFGDFATGGLIGANENGCIRDSYATGNVVGNVRAGGFAGANSACFAVEPEPNSNPDPNGNGTGDENGDDGENPPDENGDEPTPEEIDYDCTQAGVIINAYTTGTVTGEDFVGSFVGKNGIGQVEQSYWFIHSDELTDEVAAGLTFEEFGDPSAFEGWDFQVIWDLNESTAPRLKWQL